MTWRPGSQSVGTTDPNMQMMRREWAQAPRLSESEVKVNRNIAKEIDDEYYIAICHAIGQGLSTVHVETHAIGLVMYELTSIVLKNRDNYYEKVNDKINWYIKILKYFEDNVDNTQNKWASFLEKDIPNKEMILYNKKLLTK